MKTLKKLCIALLSLCLCIGTVGPAFATGENEDTSNEAIANGPQDQEFQDTISSDSDDITPALTNLGRWVKSGNRWWFRCDDYDYPKNGIYVISGTRYAFDSEGWMVTGWFWSSDYSRWFYFNGNGAMAYGWQFIDGAWYYLGAEGYMFANRWVEDSGSWYYLDGHGVMMRNSWLWWNGYWFYLTDSGAMMQNSWLWWNGHWYYLENGGSMARNKWVGSYYVNNSGAWD